MLRNFHKIKNRVIISHKLNKEIYEASRPFESLFGYIYIYISLALCSVTLLAALNLTSSTTSADAVDDVIITVPVSCNMTSTLDTAHTTTLNPGQYENDIGITNFTVFCNDNSGYAIYAIGYSNEEYGNTKMLATINNQLSPTDDINTGTNTSGANSSWAMKLVPVTTASSGTAQPYTPTIESDTNGSFANYHIVPSEHTKVATFASNTDFTIGSSLQSTYQVYANSVQPAGSYVGKVKYTLVHPNDGMAPEDPRYVSILDAGQTVNAKMKRTAGNVSASYETVDSNIVALVRANALPADFIPTSDNTITTSTSTQPIYIFFDSTNGTMYYYTEATRIKMNPVSSYFFYNMRALSDLSTVSTWDTSNVINMNGVFYNAGYNATTFTLDLSSWDTSNATGMSAMFDGAGYSATTWSVGDLSSWDTSNVTSMSYMFDHAGYNAAAFTLDLSSWDTSNVRIMSVMFNCAGYSATTWTVGDPSSWDTSSVTSMANMFSSAGYNATSFTLDLSSWNTASVTSMSNMFNSTGRNATSFTLDLSSWNTASVTSISNMFSNAGRNATAWNITIPKTNDGTATGTILNTTSNLYGNSTSVTATPPSGKSFTLAN